MFYAVFKDGTGCYVGEDAKAAMQAVGENPGCLYETAEKLEEFLDVINNIKAKSVAAPKVGCCKKEAAVQSDLCGEQPNEECCSKPVTFAEIKKQINDELKANGVEPVDFDDLVSKIKSDGEQFIADVKSYSNKGIAAVGSALTRFGNYLKQIAEPVVEEEQSNE